MSVYVPYRWPRVARMYGDVLDIVAEWMGWKEWDEEAIENGALVQEPQVPLGNENAR